MASKKKKPSKKKPELGLETGLTGVPERGKQHAIHAESLLNLANEFSAAANHPAISMMTPQAILSLLEQAFRKEGNRVREIVR